MATNQIPKNLDVYISHLEHGDNEIIIELSDKDRQPCNGFTVKMQVLGTKQPEVVFTTNGDGDATQNVPLPKGKKSHVRFTIDGAPASSFDVKFKAEKQLMGEEVGNDLLDQIEKRVGKFAAGLYNVIGRYIHPVIKVIVVFLSDLGDLLLIPLYLLSFIPIIGKFFSVFISFYGFFQMFINMSMFGKYGGYSVIEGFIENVSIPKPLKKLVDFFFFGTYGAWKAWKARETEPKYFRFEWAKSTPGIVFQMGCNFLLALLLFELVVWIWNIAGPMWLFITTAFEFIVNSFSLLIDALEGLWYLWNILD